MSDAVAKQNNKGGFRGGNKGGNRGGKGGNRGGKSNKASPPFEAEFKKRIDDLNKKIIPLTNENTALTQTATDTIEINKKLNEKLKGLFGAPKANSAIHDEQKSIIEKRDKLIKDKQALQKELNESRKGFSVRQDKLSMEEYVSANSVAIDNQIQNIEAQIRSARDMATNKQLVKEIDAIKSKKRSLETFAAKSKSLDAINKELDKYDAQYKKNKAVLDKTREEKQKHSEEINDLKAQVTANSKKIKEAFAKRDANKALIDQHYKELKVVRDEQNQKWTAWKKEQEVLRKEAEEKKRQEAEAAAKEAAAEEAAEPVVKPSAPLPHVKEIEQLDGLIAFLKGIHINKNKPNAPLKHNLDVVSSFLSFKLVPPPKASAIEQSIADITAKKEAFVKIQEEEVVRREEAAKVAAEKAAAEKAAEPVVESAEETKPAAEEPVVEEAKETTESA